MSKFHVRCKNVVHPIRTCLAQHRFGGEWEWRTKNNNLVAVANNGKLRQRFMPGVPRTFDQDCLTAGTIGNYFITSLKHYF